MQTRNLTLQVCRLTVGALLTMCLLVAIGVYSPAWASGEHGAAPASAHGETATAVKKLPATPSPKEVGQQVREALDGSPGINKKLTLIIPGKDKTTGAAAPKDAHGAGPAQVAETVHAVSNPRDAVAVVNPQASRQYIRAKAAALTGHEAPAAGGHGAGDVHWTYDGETGPQAWANLKPEFNVCAIGKRQSPINIEDSATLQGPAEPIVFNYSPSNGIVVNNGHTIQVDLSGDNSITVRGTNYKLVQFHFHHPSEERVNYKGFAMVAHLVHKSAEGQLAVVAVLLEPGAVNPLINKVWTYMPLDSGDKVRMPTSLVEMNELLPTDQRYYQFMGSLTTPPCSEGVLWLVLKQPMTVSREQLRLFSQLFPNNARPVQSANSRTIRNAQ
jgi:carbonic anhydrase